MKKPIYLLAGGKGSHGKGRETLLRRVIEETRRLKPIVGYIGAASGDNAPFRLMISGLLKASGAGEVLPVKLVGKKPDVSGAKAILDAADIVFFSGGDVEDGMRIIVESGLDSYFPVLREQGKVFFGLSAGSIMISKAWVRWRNPDDDASAEIFPCLDLASIYCDTHDEGSGWSELKALLGLLPEGSKAYGIPSGSGIAVKETVEMLGEGCEVFVKSKGKILPEKA